MPKINGSIEMPVEQNIFNLAVNKLIIKDHVP